jgi:oligopeptide/dipeptide ABC transporter ATP-binding protein
MADAAALLEVEGLRVRFRAMGAIRAALARVPDPFIDAVIGVSFTVGRGETFGLVGESGSGKTTLVRTIVGLAAVAEGRIRFDGAAVDGRSDVALRSMRRQVALMFQDPVASLSPRKTVRSLVVEPFLVHGEAQGRDLATEARELLAMVGLPSGLLDAYPHQLSGGQAQRVGVARALALRPKLIIADEPTAGLDVSVQGEVLNLFNELQASLGLSYVIVTHNLPVIRHVSDRLAIMYLGRFVEEGPTPAIFAAPRHPYTAALLKAIPQPDPDRRRVDVALAGEVPSLRRRPPGCEFHTRCPFADERCRREAPTLRAIEPARRVACHRPLGQT